MLEQELPTIIRNLQIEVSALSLMLTNELIERGYSKKTIKLARETFNQNDLAQRTNFELAKLIKRGKELMTKRKVDPVDGTLIGIAEVSAMTGFTPHQLRSWRKPEHYDKAVFEALRDPASSTVWYRLVDVEDWCEQHGKQSFMRAIPAPNAFKSSRVNEVESYEKRTALEGIAEITSENAYYVWFEKFSKVDYKRLLDKLQTRSGYYKAKILGGQPEDYQHISAPQRLANPQWFTGAVPAMRELYAELNGIDLTEEEILSVPIGQAPHYPRSTSKLNKQPRKATQMAQYEFWYSETYDYKAWFTAENQDEANALLEKVENGDLDINALPNFQSKDKGYELQLGLAEEF